MPSVLWFAAGALLAAAEVLVGDFFLLMLAGGAFAAAIASALGAPLWLAALVFAIVACSLILIVRPLLRRQLMRTPAVPMNTDALVGQRAVAVVPITRGGGQVRVDGQTWSARPADPSGHFLTGEELVVDQIDGATAVVSRGH